MGARGVVHRNGVFDNGQLGAVGMQAHGEISAQGAHVAMHRAHAQRARVSGGVYGDFAFDQDDQALLCTVADIHHRGCIERQPRAVLQGKAAAFAGRSTHIGQPDGGVAVPCPGYPGQPHTEHQRLEHRTPSRPDLSCGKGVPCQRAMHAGKACLQLLQAPPSPTVQRSLVEPGLPLCPVFRAIRCCQKARMPVCRFAQGLALVGGAHSCASKANSRQRSVALAMYFVTELTDTPRRCATSG
ncbi:hypothetical protein D3C79_704800 [compost metagenome]